MSPPAAAPAGLAARCTRVLLSPRSRLVLLLALLACGAAVTLWWQPQHLLTGARPAGPSGPAALALFALAYGACTSAFVPRPVLSLAAGALFGSQAGLATALAGTVLSAALTFGLGRLLGQDALRPLLHARWLTAVDRQLSEHGFRSMLVIRLFPGLPFCAMNYCAGISRMGWGAYLAATALGSIPNTAAYAVAGARASTPTSPVFLAAMGFIAVSALGALVVAWCKRKALRGG
ncbi:TVP38/TMEM64 family protein [Streptomyces sp. 2112.3]|uniref:TVP38/TMEM64 family protein n=1 Tax=Streptomyces sp. 2112.3 TaxID=1881023 RepID=UPI000B83D01B|nr:VTT domain-containing protein [Streptomyces sp. 2112.3]